MKTKNKKTKMKKELILISMGFISLLLSILLSISFVATQEEVAYWGCTDNSSASAYDFNQVFYIQPYTGNFSSFCVDANELMFLYCEEDIVSVRSLPCRCSQKKCLPGHLEIPYWITEIGTYDRFAGGTVDNSFINWVINGWINR